MRKVEQKLIVEEFYTRFQEKYEKCQCFYSSDWLERPSVKREVTGSTPVRNAFPLLRKVEQNSLVGEMQLKEQLVGFESRTT